jgi:L-ascorbate metabolism protein UlaG (beta-lactamase superfamily)
VAQRVSDSSRLTFVGHSTVLIELDGVRILTDPILRNRVGPLRRQTGTVDPALYSGIDVALVSHPHWDHLDVPSLRKLGAETTLVVPAGTRRALRIRRIRNVEELKPGESIDIGPIRISATTANHEVIPNLLARDAAAMGFLIEGTRRLYFAGDTDLFDEMAALAEGLDVALLPVWGWGPVLGPGHLDPGRAAEALQLLRPRVAVPIHWGTLAPIGLKLVRGDDWLHHPPREFRRHAARTAPDVDVRVVRPGGSTGLG